MLDQTTRNEITNFVRNKLGCQCPEEAFRTIVLEAGVTASGTIRYTRIVIGDRLLVYVFNQSESEHLDLVIPELAGTGIKERDDRKYNRFRLVVASRPPGQPSDQAVAIFRKHFGQDEKAYIHLVSGDDLPRVLGFPRPDERG